MSLFHTHRWVEVSRDFTPPLVMPEYDTIGSSVSCKVLESQQQGGTTHVYLKCSECGNIMQKDLAGNYRNSEK